MEDERKPLDREDFSGPFLALEDARKGQQRARVFREPRSVLCANSPGELITVLEQAEHALASGHHVAGYFAYELGYLLEPRLAGLLWQDKSTPLAWLGVFPQCETFEGAQCDGLLPAAGRAHAGPLALEWSEREYEARFSRLHEWITAGDLYQANLTLRAWFSFTGDPRALYRDLKRQARAGYCAYVDDGERQILSLSPELFFDVASDGVIRTRPMKGTSPRGENTAEDARSRAHLLASEKERAENLMIVDLMRNDLSRIADVGTVEVERLFEIETYPTLHQLVSTIAARRRSRASIGDILRALFPCGSVTGAPKIRSMEVIRELEDSPRGVYCGAIGSFAPDGSAQLNVAIRTLTIEGNRGKLGIGGGVVFNSRSSVEYAECLLKARYFESARSPLQLIETLRWSPEKHFVRCKRHLARMTRSAAEFHIPFDQHEAMRRMSEAVGDSRGPVRVRLVLSEDGAVSATATPLDKQSAPAWRYAFAAKRVQSGDIFLRHKTSRRELFDAEHARAADSDGADDVLFLNERGEITEGSRTNVFVEIGDRLLTPAYSCGLLDGCLRRELIDQGRCQEAILSPDDLKRASAVFVGNSLRGLIPAVPATAEGGR